MTPKSKRKKKQKLIELYGCYCFWCAKPLTEKEMTLDHLLPKSRGGSNSEENLRLTCKSCNNSRGNSLFPPKWATLK